MGWNGAKQAFTSESVVTLLTYGFSVKPKPEMSKLNLDRVQAIVTLITDWEKFRAFAQKHRDQTQVEIAQLWDSDISDAFRELC